MAKGSRGGKAGSSGSSSGKAVSARKGESIGTVGTGIAVTSKNGKVINYIVTNGGLMEVRSGRPAPKSKTMTTQEQVKKMLENSNTKFLSKSDVDKLLKQYREDRANTPDYELGLGTPWGNRGASKRVYRPSRMKW